MTRKVIADSIVDGIAPRAPGELFLSDVGAGAVARSVPAPLVSLCSLVSYDDARVLAHAATTRITGSSDHQGFAFHDAGTVILFADDAEVTVTAGAFYRLLGRLLGALISAAEIADDPVITADWWSGIVEARDTSSRRGGAGSEASA